jgi:hypothetical protein
MDSGKVNGAMDEPDEDQRRTEVVNDKIGDAGIPGIK